MRTPLLLLPLLAVLPLCAQSYEVGLFVGRQSYPSINYSDPIFGGLNQTEKAKAVGALRLGYSLVAVGPVLLQATASYQPKADSTLTTSSPQGGPQSITQPFNSSHYAVGAMANLKAVVAVGAGLEYRFETVANDVATTHFGRPWARVNAGYAFPTPILKPFVGVELDVPLTTKTLAANFDESDYLQAMAPKLEIGLYGGIRF
jgi:hypothetical protein